jgi:hypothetical protein
VIILNSRRVTIDRLANDQVLKDAVHMWLGAQLTTFYSEGLCNIGPSVFKSRVAKFCIVVVQIKNKLWILSDLSTSYIMRL